jgi:hypothetical protein
VPHGVIIALELAGAVLILAGFTLAQLRLLDQHSLVYLVSTWSAPSCWP